MRRGIKFHIMSRLVAVLVLTLIAFTVILYYTFSIIMRGNLFRNGSQHAQKNVAQIESALEDVYMTGEFLSLDSEVRRFLRQQDYPSPSARVRSIFGMMNHLTTSMAPKKYVHSFCMVDSTGASYWSRCPYDEFFMDWFVEHSGVEQRPPSPFVGFTDSYPCPTYNSMYNFDTIVSCVINIRRTDRGVVSSGEQLIVNLNLDLLMRDIRASSSVFDQIGILGGDGRLLYLSGGDEEVFLERTAALPAGMERVDDTYYFTSELSGNGWRVISSYDNTQLRQMVDSPVIFSLVAVIAAALGLIFLFVFPYLLRITREIVRLDQAMQQVADGDLETRVSLGGARELTSISDGFNHMVIRTKDYMDESLQNLQEKQKLHFDLLLARINPHFIYNTLNSVIYLARQGNGEAIIDLTSAFISLLQDSIHQRSGNMFEQVSAELEVVRRYVTIQNYRYAGRFRFREEIDPDLPDVWIPRNVLQPLIENAILHGMSMKTEPGEIWLRIARREDLVAITIEDDGIGIPPERMAGLLRPDTGEPGHSPPKIRPIAISNIVQRLEYLFPDTDSFSIRSQPGAGTVITITIPVLVEAPV